MLKGLFRFWLLRKLFGGGGGGSKGGCGCIGLIVVLVLVYFLYQYFAGGTGSADF